MPAAHGAPDAPRNPHRRQVLAAALAAAGCLSLAPARALAAAGLSVPNITGLYTVPVARIEAPVSTAGVVQALASWPGQVAVGGARCSMGGQVAIAGGLHLDMRAMNRLLWLRADERRVRVQAGMRWRDLQDHIDPLGLAVHTMQSYANFTVGGSVSVNAHGRYVGHGPVGHSVRALQLVLADGQVVEANRSLNTELFRAAIGGYGAVGLITEVELDLAENVRIRRQVAKVALQDYLSHFDHQVLGPGDAVLHNADLLPPHFDAPISTTWRRTQAPLTETARLVPRGLAYGPERQVLWAVTELPGGDALRQRVLQPLLTGRPVVQWLNHEASLDLAQLEPHSRRHSTYALQEYFVPRAHFLGFARALAKVLRQHRVAAVNVSIRHSPPDRDALLPWAPQAVFTFVLFYKQGTSDASQQAVGRWTRALIDQVLEHGGRHYLPYQLHATQAQFDAAYPEAAALRALRQRVDPGGRWQNSLWQRYL